MKRILHIDMDAFFASVEQVKDPSLKGKPVIIGGSLTDTRGVVSTASYEARKFGIHSAMPLAQARKRCPQGVFLRGNLKEYAAISKTIHHILFEVSPLVQMTSIDEGYIDITGSIHLFKSEDAIAAHIKETIHARTGLNCTIGISDNKLISKVASGDGKPNGYINVPSGQERHFLAPLALQKIPGAGAKTCEALAKRGIRTVADLGRLTRDELITLFGKSGIGLHRVAQGKGNDTISMEHAPKSIGKETTFQQNKTDWSEIESVVSDLMERTLFILREKGYEGKRITLKVRNQHFKTYTYTRTLSIPTDQDSVVWEQLKALMTQARARGGEVRLIGMNIADLSNDQHQLLLDDPGHSAQWEKAMKEVDHLRERFGFNTLRKGKSIQ